MAQKIGLISSVRRTLLPPKRFALQHDVDKSLGARRVVAINQQAGDIGNVARFESVAEEQNEKRRQNQKQKQHSFVAINVKELLVGDAEDGVERGVHERKRPTLNEEGPGKRQTPNAERGRRKRPTLNAQRSTANEKSCEVILRFALLFGCS